MSLTDEEWVIYNEGERLIPGRSHDYTEVRRHYGSYLFFKEVIAWDQARHPVPNGPTIVDLGCGVGHGCQTLAQIPGAKVLGVDISRESLDYAKRNYDHPAISWQQSDLVAFVESMPAFDYVVSRGVLEHIPNGIDLAVNAKWNRRIMFDVPYAEPRGRNPHHVLSEITETDFDRFEGAELFFQDLSGVVYATAQKPIAPNMIMCACRKGNLPQATELLASNPFIVDWNRQGPEARVATEAVSVPSEVTLAQSVDASLRPSAPIPAPRSSFLRHWFGSLMKQR